MEEAADSGETGHEDKRNFIINRAETQQLHQGETTTSEVETCQDCQIFTRFWNKTCQGDFGSQQTGDI